MKPHWSERVKNYIEIVAILVGGIWALFTFVIKDTPSLALRRKAVSKLEWITPLDKSLTRAVFNVTLENTGSSTFNIKKVILKAWTYNEWKLETGENAKYVDINQIKHTGTIFFDTTYTYIGHDDSINLGKPFIGRYNEGAVWNESFEFLLRPDSGKMVLLLITFYEADHEDEQFEWTYQWDYIGGIDSAYYHKKSFD